MRVKAGAVSSAVAPLFGGPVDVVGDVHGEIDALRDLLGVLGYDRHGEHSAGRRLVFVGDLCDRGPDSPAVVGLVGAMLGRGLAQCVLGNHELNILRGDHKAGNGWFFGRRHRGEAPAFRACAPLPPERERDVAELFAELPLALERSDLRVVHAAWSGGAIEALRGRAGSTVELCARFAEEADAELDRIGLREKAAREEAEYDRMPQSNESPLPMFAAFAQKDEIHQNNPVRFLTSGPEQQAGQPFWANGKWRMCDRLPWWNRYDDDVPVIVGHYWRMSAEAKLARSVRDHEPDIFAGSAPEDWLGPRRNAYCADFSVGRRFEERRARTAPPFRNRLAAVRWPEREVVFDDGRGFELRG